MGTTITYDNIVADQQKLEDLKNVPSILKDQFQKMKFTPGKTVAEHDSFISINDKENQGSLFASIVKIFKAQANGGFNKVYEIMATQLDGLVNLSRNGGLIMQQKKIYPIPTSTGFVIGYFILFLQKFTVKIGNSTREQVVMISKYKLISPPPPKTKADLGSYIAASTIQTNEERDEVLNGLWRIILSTWPIEDIKDEIEKARLIQEMRKLGIFK